MHINFLSVRNKMDNYLIKSTLGKTVVSTNFLSSILKFRKNWSSTKSISFVFIILLITGLLLTLLAAELLTPGEPEVFVGMDIGYGSNDSKT